VAMMTMVGLFVEFHLTNLHIMVLGVFGFPGNRCRESSTFLTDVSVITYRICVPVQTV
jgi:hypothetical protein